MDKTISRLIYRTDFNYRLHPTVESRTAPPLTAPIINQPGEKWSYSAATDLLAVVLKKVSQQEVNVYLKKIFLILWEWWIPAIT